MDFGKALRQLRAGHRLRRGAWRVGWLEIDARGVILHHATAVSWRDWPPLQVDLLAEDWSVVG
jgi:hypothetical protein